MTTAVLVLGGVTVGAGGTTLTATTIAAPGGSADPINFLNWIPGQGQEGAPAGHIVFGPAGQVGVITHAVNATTVALAAPWVGAALAGGTCQLIFSINALPIGRQATIIANIVALRPLLKSNNLSEYLGDATAQAAVRESIGLSASVTPFTPVGGITATDVQAALQELDSEKAADSAVVKLTGNQTIAGTKTFSAPLAASITGNAATVFGYAQADFDFRFIGDLRLGAATVIAVDTGSAPGYNRWKAPPGCSLVDIFQSQTTSLIDFPAARPIQKFSHFAGIWVTVSEA